MPEEEIIAFTYKQISEYEEIIKRAKDMNFPEMHCLNSAGGLWHRLEESGYVHLGIIGYEVICNISSRVS
ncbi:MAG: hypothetical protein ACLSEX_11595 [Blautia sp.]